MDILTKLFKKANKRLMNEDLHLFQYRLSEICFCAALSKWMERLIYCEDEQLNPKFQKLHGYHADVEYNRNYGGEVKRTGEKVTVRCDMILHSRGTFEKDNKIAIEMKKSNHTIAEKNKARQRLKVLTTPINSKTKPLYSARGKSFPEYVCGYELGIYYELVVCVKKGEKAYGKIRIEYYKDGEKLNPDYEKEVPVWS